MVDSEFSTYVYKSLKISIRSLIKNPKMLKFVPDHLKAKNMWTSPVTKLTFVTRYVPD